MKIQGSLQCKILNLITSANTLFSNKVTFIGSRDYHLMCGGLVVRGKNGKAMQIILPTTIIVIVFNSARCMKR